MYLAYNSGEDLTYVVEIYCLVRGEREQEQQQQK